MSGGDGGAAGGAEVPIHVAIQAEAASLDELVARVTDPAAGAVASFVGVVRSEHRGEAVTALEYEFYEGMAEREMARICAEAGAKHGLSRVALVHRHGRFAVGEPVVWIAVSAPHRDAAFAGCSFLIEELKKRVPIWKKETTVERARWIGGEE